MSLPSGTCGPFVDSVKFAVRGLPARGAPARENGNHLRLHRPKGALRRGWHLVWPSLLAIAFGAASAQADPAYVPLGHEAPDFALHAIVGGNVRLSEHRGDVIVLSFWGSRCTPCRAQLAALNRSLSTYRSAGLQVYGVSVDDDQNRARAFAHGESVTFTLLLDPDKTVSRAYLVDNLPMTVLIDRSGIVRYVLRDYNAKSEELYLQQLRALLNE
jgi:peroxiredoxin